MDRSEIEEEMEPYMDLLLDIGAFMMSVINEIKEEKSTLE